MTLYLTQEETQESNNCYTHIKGDKDLSFLESTKIIDSAWEDIKTLRIGGTQSIKSSEFKQIFDYIMYKEYNEKNKPILVLETDLLLSEDLMSFLYEYIQNKMLFSLYITIPKLEEDWKRNLFIKNLDAFYSILPPESLAFNIDYNLEVPSKENIKFLYKKYPKIKEIFIHPITQKCIIKDVGYRPWLNKLHNSKVYTIARVSWKMGKKVNFLCNILPCMFSYRQYKKLKINTNTSVYCRNETLNIFADGTLSLCPIFKDTKISIKNWTELGFDYQEEINKARSLPNICFYRCVDCKYHKMQLCNGPCHGCKGIKE